MFAATKTYIQTATYNCTAGVLNSKDPNYLQIGLALCVCVCVNTSSTSLIRNNIYK